MKLTDREWKEFKIGDLFILDKNKRQVPTGAYVHKDNLNKGYTPRITVTSMNNGIDDYWESIHKNYRCYKNFISVSFLGDCFYHKYNASLDMKVHCLKLKKFELNENIASFILSCLKNNTKSSSYGNQLSSTDLPAKSVLLPVNDKNDPDYQFMEDYIKEKMLQRRQEYIEYAKNKLKQIKFENISSLKDKKWKEFFIEDIFFIKSGKRLVKEQMIFGNIPFIGASTLNNGITNYISQKNCSFDSNVLGVNYNGSVGEAFYHPYGCIFSDDVKRFHMLNYNDNKFLLLFLATIIKQQKEKFNYGYKFNETRMLRQKILLPVNNNDEPDYIYMEKYIKNIFYKKYSDYLEYVKKAV